MLKEFNFLKIEDQKEFEELPEKEREKIIGEAQEEAGEINASSEFLKEDYKKRLDAILNRQLTVENIETFADDALNETIQLSNDVKIQYQKINSDITLAGRKQEDQAFKTFELPDIQEILKSIIEVIDEINSLKEYIHINAEYVDKVITPADASSLSLSEGDGQWEQKRMFPRVLTLLYVLEHDFNILPDDTRIIKGKVTQEMMRQTPYVRVDIPELERAVYLCDEEGNVSYIFDTNKIREKNLIIDEIDVDSKGDKNSLIAIYPGIGVRLKQTNIWRNNMVVALKESLFEKIINKSEKISEFRREKKEFLPFEDFQQEAQSLYLGEGDVQRWYWQEYKNHPNWPSNPNRTYKDKGWEGLSELVGKENRLKKEYPIFKDFQQEVRSLYTREGDVAVWYRQEYKNHPNWPFSPDMIYKNKGWEGWSELVGKENKLKKEYPIFKDFQQEVQNLYLGEMNVEKWYWQEYKKHPNWPSQPYKIYKNKGWEGWPELIGEENQLKKEYLSFKNFQQEVQSLYLGEGDVKKWYNQEYKNHPNWSSNPDRIYKDKGWKGWSELVEKENRLKKEYPIFKDFQQEVQNLYSDNKKGDVSLWYNQEYKNHSNWPSQPYVIYKDKGWEGFLELVGKEKNNLK